MSIPFNFLQNIPINDSARHIGTEEQPKYLFADERFNLSYGASGALVKSRSQLVNLSISFPSSGFFLPLFSDNFSFSARQTGQNRRDYNGTFSFLQQLSGNAALIYNDSFGVAASYSGEFSGIPSDSLNLGFTSYSGEFKDEYLDFTNIAVELSGNLIKINSDKVRYCQVLFTGFYMGTLSPEILEEFDGVSYCQLIYTGSYQGA